MLGLAEELSAPYSVHCLRAPWEHPVQGYAWFDLDFAGSTVRADLSQAGAAVSQVADYLQAHGPDWIVGGFSQGAMIAAALSRHARALWLMSGRFLPGLHQFESLDGLPALVQHGELDPVVPFDDGRLLADRMIKSGAHVDFLAYPIGHGVSPQGVVDARTWILGLDAG